MTTVSRSAPDPVHDTQTPRTEIPTTDARDATACRFDPAATRAWLTSEHPTGEGTVADALRIGDDFDVYGFDKWVRITDLLDAAQAAAVFGVAEHTVGVLHLAGEHGFVDRHRVTLTTAGHGMLCSDDLDTAELLTDHLCGVDAAVNLLGQTANATDMLLHQRARLAETAWPRPTATLDQPNRAATRSAPQPRPGKAFRPLALGDPAASPPAPPALDSTASTPRRHR